MAKAGLSVHCGLRIGDCGLGGKRKAPPLPFPVASQARHESVSPEGTFALRNVVPHSMAEREKEALGSRMVWRSRGAFAFAKATADK